MQRERSIISCRFWIAIKYSLISVVIDYGYIEPCAFVVSHIKTDHFVRTTQSNVSSHGIAAAHDHIMVLTHISRRAIRSLTGQQQRTDDRLMVTAVNARNIIVERILHCAGIANQPVNSNSN